MGEDRTERKRRGQTEAKTSNKTHPHVRLEHRIIDSPAYIKLSGASDRVLTAMLRQLNGSNNGQLQATFSFMAKYGIGSEHTLQRAIAQLIAHGLIYRTRSHGANGAWARYAVTWLPIQNREGLFLAGFKKDAWREWGEPPRAGAGIEKSSLQKVQE